MPSQSLKGTLTRAEVESVYVKTTLDIVGVTILGMELNKLGSTASSTLDFEECYHCILGQSFLGFLVTFVNAFVLPLRWLPIAANREFLLAKNTIWGIVRELVQKRFAEAEARKDSALNGEKGDSRDLLTYMIEANLSGDKALSREQIIEDVGSLSTFLDLTRLIPNRCSSSSLLHTRLRLGL